MKKTLLTLIAVASMSFAMAQNCTPDPQYTTPGVYPDSATGIPVAIVGVAYDETITAVTPADTCIVLLFPPCTTIPIDSVVIDQFDGLPAGFTVVSENQSGLNFVFLGGTSSCMRVTGTATAGQVGSYPLTVSGLSWAQVLGVATSQPFNVDYYTLEVVLSTGIEGQVDGDFEVKQNTPNPFSNTSNIEFYLEKENAVSISIFNVLGKEVLTEVINASKGTNNYLLNANDFSNGIYFYNLTSSNKTITQRFIVNK
ncbi:MAG: T9SS type A sorting domain-containing protein [Flavobacteriales bacterium]|nr:T9SS type A sorting domain-containing protein [Flavobacteriales bacterium]